VVAVNQGAGASIRGEDLGRPADSPVETLLNRDIPATKVLDADACRGGAALLVLLFHCTERLGAPKYFDFKQLAFGGAFEFGSMGVDLFFVLSGFVISYRYSGDVGRISILRTYLYHRVARIYPTYLVIMLVTLPIFFIYPGFGVGNETSLVIIIVPIRLTHSATTSRVLPFAGIKLTESRSDRVSSDAQQ